eukprot:1554260-Prymnesium_polylepis.2
MREGAVRDVLCFPRARLRKAHAVTVDGRPGVERHLGAGRRARSDARGAGAPRQAPDRLQRQRCLPSATCQRLPRRGRPARRRGVCATRHGRRLGRIRQRAQRQCARHGPIDTVPPLPRGSNAVRCLAGRLLRPRRWRAPHERAHGCVQHRASAQLAGRGGKTAHGGPPAGGRARGGVRQGLRGGAPTAAARQPGGGRGADGGGSGGRGCLGARRRRVNVCSHRPLRRRRRRPWGCRPPSCFGR